MSFNMKMFDSKVNVVVVKSSGYDAIVPHSHEFVELVYVVSGEAENKLGDERIPLKSGDVFVMADKEIQHSVIYKATIEIPYTSTYIMQQIVIKVIYLQILE